MASTKKQKGLSFGLILLSLIFLANINLSIFDFLPDTVAFLILAAQLKYASERAPFFAETRDSFKTLAIIAIFKYPAAFLITKLGNGDMAGFALFFSVIEAVYLFKAIGNLFNGLYRLGERAESSILISPFKVGGQSYMAVDTLRFFTYLFAVVKCVFQVLPDLLRLPTVSADGTSIVPITNGYPIAVLMTQFFGLIIGVFWIVITAKYIKSISRNRQFETAIDIMLSSDDKLRLERKEKIDTLTSALSLLAFSTIFTVEIRFFDSDAINLLPHTVFAILLISVAVKLWRIFNNKIGIPLFTASVMYAISTLITYVFEVKFLYYEGYGSIQKTSVIPASYITVEILSVIEAVLLVFVFAFIAIALHEAISDHTGSSLGAPAYLRSDKKFHASLFSMNFIFELIGIFFSVFRCLTVFSYSTYTKRVMEINDQTIEAEIAGKTVYYPVLQWASPVCSIFFVALIALTFYYTAVLRDEIKIKYAAKGDIDL